MSLSTAAVVSAAVRLVNTHGEAGLGWNRLARELGVKPPSLYNHVTDAQELRRRVAIRGWEQYASDAERVVGRRKGESAIRVLAHAYRATSLASPGVFAVVSTTRLAPDDPDFAAVARRIYQVFDAPLRDMGVASADAGHVLRALRATVHGFVSLELQGLFAATDDIERSFQRAVDFITAGIRANL